MYKTRYQGLSLNYLSFSFKKMTIFMGSAFERYLLKSTKSYILMFESNYFYYKIKHFIMIFEMLTSHICAIVYVDCYYCLFIS